ncbi:F-box protein [Rhizoctonia solani 123E]|uniref:F-box protein n=1 Tax=Rhizoctonia solani 123E TaxID=1423351 RepID=A0A074SFD2_9AGAM|nr:F-box protein [Rhizoctonia solani 123E]
MVTRGYVGYRHNHWVADRIYTLENATTTEIIKQYEYTIIQYPHDGVGADELGYGTTYDNKWTFPTGMIEFTYVFDLDNMVFTFNGTTHFRLDNMPPTLDCLEEKVGIPTEYLRDKVDLWPIPDFDIEEQRHKYEALQPIIVPAKEWGAPTWDELSVSHQFSIALTHQWLSHTSDFFKHAYVPAVRNEAGQFGWDVLCASVPALPVFQENDFKALGLSSRTLSSGFSTEGIRPPYCGRPPPQRSSNEEYDPVAEFNRQRALTVAAFRAPYRQTRDDCIEYFWVRDCLVTFCVRLAEPIYVAHEVEKMAQKMRLVGSTESVGIILSTQRELIVVAVDELQVRHSPVLDISIADGRPGRASDGQMLLTYLLSPSCTTPPLPWRPIQSRHSLATTSSSATNLPPEVLRAIVELVDIGTYLALCCVSRTMHAVCVANPRFREYTVLHKVPGFETVFIARSAIDHTLKMIEPRWQDVRSDGYLKRGKWEVREVSTEELDEMKSEEV